jgi:hypothetical protein
LPFLVPDFRIAMTVAVIVVLAELGTISWIRHRYMEKPPLTAALQVGWEEWLVFLTGVLIGSSQCVTNSTALPTRRESVRYPVLVSPSAGRQDPIACALTRRSAHPTAHPVAVCVPATAYTGW